MITVAKVEMDRTRSSPNRPAKTNPIEVLHPALQGRLPLGGRGVLGQPGLGDAADHGDLLAVDRDLGQFLEEVVGKAAGEPAAQFLSLLCRNHVMTITPPEHEHKGSRSSRPRAESECFRPINEPAEIGHLAAS
ncbi:hypothetical protein SVIOM74S_09878 [Streptomyces violarus]